MDRVPRKTPCAIASRTPQGMAATFLSSPKKCQMVSLLRSLFKGKFPEYSEFETALENLRGHGLAICDSVGKAFTPSFDNFCDRQAASVKPGMTKIGAQGKLQVKALQHLFTAMAELPSQMSILRDMNIGMQKELSELHAAQDQANKSKSEEQKAVEAVQRATYRGSEQEKAKCEQRLNTLKEKRKQDEEAVEQLQQKFQGYQSEYRQNFTNHMAKNLTTAIDCKLKELEELSAIAQEIVDAATKISEYTDASVPRLQQKLDELEQQQSG